MMLLLQGIQIDQVAPERRGNFTIAANAHKIQLTILR
jgi:hypothetical protein